MKYLEHKGISLYDKEVMKMCGHPLNPNYEIFPGIYLRPCNLGDLTMAIDLESKGSYDFAVPESWAREHNYPKGLDQAVWLYRKESRIFGEPFTVKQMLEELRRQLANEAFAWYFNKEGIEG